MAQYEKVFTKPYADGYEDLPSQNTPITASTLNDKDAAIEHIEDFLDGQEFPTAEEKAVWNSAQNLYQYTLLDQVAQINSNTVGVVQPIAIRDYAKDDLFIQQKKLCKAITAITQYDELVKNTNYIEVNIADELGLKVGKDASAEKTTTTGKFSTVNGGKLESCIVAFDPIQSGSGDPSPSNVRPITGHSSVENRIIDKDLLTHTATTQTLNGLTFTVSGTKITVNGTATAQTYIEIGSTGDLPEGDYWYSGLPSDASTNTYFITRNASSNNTVSDRIWNTSGVQSPRIYVRNGVTCDNVVFDIAISKAYEKTTTPLGQTVYGGNLDVVSGVLTVTHTFNEFDGSLDEGWAINGTGSGQNPFANIGVSDNNTTTSIICNEFTATTIYTSNQNVGVYKSTTNLRVRPDFALTDATAWKTWLSSNPLQVCYPLATPLTIQLTPQQINTLIGENHLDVPLEGQSLDSAVYRELFAWDDVKDVVELRLPISAIGTDESNNDNASQAYSQGDYFYKNGIAKAKTNIASGATFTLGTNYEIKTLAEILRTLES